MPSAREIINEQTHRHTLSNETSMMEITLIDRKGNEEQRVLNRLEKNHAMGLCSSLVVFYAPADVKGTALLTRENKGKPNDQWFYFPSQRRLQRIAQGRRSGYFMGTDFTYEDMDPKNMDDFIYNHLRTDQIDGQECYVIEARPADHKAARSSGYAKRELWIRMDILFTIQTKFYDRHDRLIKIQTNSDLTQIKNTAWRTNHLFMDNIQKMHKTSIRITHRDTQTPIPDDTFKERHITTGRYLK